MTSSFLDLFNSVSVIWDDGRMIMKGNKLEMKPFKRLTNFPLPAGIESGHLAA